MKNFQFILSVKSTDGRYLARSALPKGVSAIPSPATANAGTMGNLPIEPLLKFVVDVSEQVDISLLAVWLMRTFVAEAQINGQQIPKKKADLEENLAIIAGQEEEPRSIGNKD